MDKNLIIFGVAVLLICAGLSGCNEIQSSKEESTDDDFWDDDDNAFWNIEIITISGVETERTIHYLNKPVKLVISGVENDVTVTKETNLVEVILSGVDCIVRVSKSHSFTSMISGVDSEIVYYDW